MGEEEQRRGEDATEGKALLTTTLGLQENQASGCDLSEVLQLISAANHPRVVSKPAASPRRPGGAFSACRGVVMPENALPIWLTSDQNATTHGTQTAVMHSSSELISISHFNIFSPHGWPDRLDSWTTRWTQPKH